MRQGWAADTRQEVLRNTHLSSHERVAKAERQQNALRDGQDRARAVAEADAAWLSARMAAMDSLSAASIKPVLSHPPPATRAPHLHRADHHHPTHHHPTHPPSPGHPQHLAPEPDLGPWGHGAAWAVDEARVHAAYCVEEGDEAGGGTGYRVQGEGPAETRTSEPRTAHGVPSHQAPPVPWSPAHLQGDQAPAAPAPPQPPPSHATGGARGGVQGGGVQGGGVQGGVQGGAQDAGVAELDAAQGDAQGVAELDAAQGDAAQGDAQGEREVITSTLPMPAAPTAPPPAQPPPKFITLRIMPSSFPWLQESAGGEQATQRLPPDDIPPRAAPEQPAYMYMDDMYMDRLAYEQHGMSPVVERPWTSPASPYHAHARPAAGGHVDGGHVDGGAYPPQLQYPPSFVDDHPVRSIGPRYPPAVRADMLKAEALSRRRVQGTGYMEAEALSRRREGHRQHDQRHHDQRYHDHRLLPSSSSTPALLQPLPAAPSLATGGCAGGSSHQPSSYMASLHPTAYSLHAGGVQGTGGARASRQRPRRQEQGTGSRPPAGAGYREQGLPPGRSASATAVLPSLQPSLYPAPSLQPSPYPALAGSLQPSGTSLPAWQCVEESCESEPSPFFLHHRSFASGLKAYAGGGLRPSARSHQSIGRRSTSRPATRE